MKPGLRVALFAVAVLCLVPAVWHVAAAMPPFGSETAQYGMVVNKLGPELRHISNMVSAVNFDFRGLDTIGEEFMLVGAVTGAVLLLRGSRGENIADRADVIAGRAVVGRAESTILICRVFGPLLLLFGLYMALHATVTPGGGFQGGVMLASGLVLAYLGEGYRGWRRLVGSRVMDLFEGGGAFVFALAGLAPMAAGAAFLENVLPLGKFKDVFSGGLMLIENAGVAFAVTGGFTLLFLEFLEETRVVVKGDGGAEERR